MVDYRIISIGTLSRHPLWDEAAAVRTPHATTTLIRGGGRVLLVDPGLPGPVVAARLFERSGLRPQQVTDVFLTHFRPAHRVGLAAFDKAQWWIGEMERETVGKQWVARHEQAGDEPKLQELLKQEIELLRRCRAAPDKGVGGIDGVDLFPLPGYTPGQCGLLLSLPVATVLIASDAVPTVEHLERGQVLGGGYDTAAAMESFKEAVEIADWIIPGHDNIIPNLTRRMF